MPCRLKSLAQAVDGATASPRPQQQFLRLPVDSARKLRFYDRPDLSDLVTQHAQDKARLQAAIDALRQVRFEWSKESASGSHSALPDVEVLRAQPPEP